MSDLTAAPEGSLVITAAPTRLRRVVKYKSRAQHFEHLLERSEAERDLLEKQSAYRQNLIEEYATERKDLLAQVTDLHRRLTMAISVAVLGIGCALIFGLKLWVR